MKTCEDCGCRMSDGYCTNCDEEVFIMEQYYELNMAPPGVGSSFMKKYQQSINDKQNGETTNTRNLG